MTVVPTSGPARPRRVVVAGAGAGGESLVRHARRLRDAGAEVIWLGDGLEPAQIVAVALSEDADAVAVAGDVAEVGDGLARAGLDDVTVETVDVEP